MGTSGNIGQGNVLLQAVPKAPPWYVQFAINSGIVTLHQVLHNPNQAAYLKDVLLQLRDAINATYPGE